MDFTNTPITDLIPQRSPFIMVDRVVSCDGDDTVTEFIVRGDNIFLDGEKLSTTGVMENMAQSCAARMGCLNMMNGESMKIGFIGDIRKCAFLKEPRIGERITTFVHVLEDVGSLTLTETTAKIGDEVIAYATMKIALVDKMQGETNSSESIKDLIQSGKEK